MTLKTYSKYIVIIGTLIIWAIKFFIRPYMHIDISLQPLVDVAPNLIGSFLLPFGTCWLFQRYFGLQTLPHLKHTCWFGLTLVVINEYLQLIPIFGRTFDYLNILFSFIGVYAGYYLFAKLMANTALQNSTDQLV